MANKIKRSDIFAEEDVFKGIRDSAKKTIGALDTINSKLKETAKTLKSALASQKLDSTKAIKELAVAIEKANKINQQAVKISQLKAKAQQEEAKASQQLQRIETEKQRTAQQTLRTEQEKEKLTRSRMQTQRQQARETERQAKADEKARKEAEKQNSAYNQLASSVRNLKNASKEYGAQLLALERDGKRGTAEWYKLSRAYQEVTQKAQQGDAQLKKLDKTVGDNFRNVGNYESALNKLGNAFSLFGVAFGASAITGFATRAVMDYEVQNSKLASVLGTVTTNTKNLQAVQRELGRTTAFTAGDVARLQVELAKLGFVNEEIEKSSNGILKLAGATGTDLARSSEIAGATLRGFGLDASQMNRVTDVMAKSFSTSALDMEKFAESMKYVAPVALQAGYSIEETSAMLGVLANQGVKGSQAGTSLRRIFTDMALTGKPAKEALAEVTKGGITLVDAFDEVGRTAQTSLAILGNNMDQVADLTKTYQLSAGAVDQMYRTMTDNLQGAVDRLSSAWESYILDVNESTGASKSLQGILDFLANNLVAILDVVATVVEVWIKYKIITLAQIGYNKLLASSFMQTARNIGGLKGVAQGLTGIMQSLGRAIQSNIVGLTAFVGINAFFQFKKLNDIAGKYDETLAEVKQQTDELTRSTEEQKKRANFLFDELKKGNLTYEQKDKLLKKINAEYGITLQNLKDEKEMVAQVDKAQKELIKTLDKKLAFQKAEARYRTLSTRFSEVTAEMDAIDATMNQMSLGEEIVGNLFRFFGATSSAQLTNEYNALGEVQAKLRTELNLAEKEYEKLFKEFELGTITGTGGGGGGGGGGGTTPTPPKTPEIREYELAMQNLNRYIERQIQLQQELNVLYQDADFVKQADGIEGLINDAVAKAKNKAIEGLDPFDFTVEGEVFDINEKAIIDLYEFAKTIAKQRTDFEISEIKRKNEEEKEQARQTILDNFAEQKKTYDEQLKELSKADPTDVNIVKSKANLNKALANLEKQRDDQLAKLTEDNLKRDKDANTEIEIAKQNLSDKEIQIEKDKNQKIIEYNDKMVQGVEEGYQRRGENIKNQTEAETKATKEALDKLKQRWSDINEAVKFITDFFIQQSDRRIQQLEKERAQAEKNYDTLKQLAINGNIQAQQSLAVEQAVINEKNRLIAKEQKFQQRIKLTASVFDAYSKNVNALKEGEDSSKALGNTIRDISLLTQFIASLPTFEKGTEDTGTHGQGIDGKGGFKAILHPNERVLTKEQNRKVGNLTNEELAMVAQEYRNGKLATFSNQPETDQTNKILIEKIENLTQVIKNKPETDYAIGEVASGLVEVVKKTKTQNTTVYNRYRIKP